MLTGSTVKSPLAGQYCDAVRKGYPLQDPGGCLCLHCRLYMPAVLTNCGLSEPAATHGQLCGLVPAPAQPQHCTAWVGPSHRRAFLRAPLPACALIASHPFMTGPSHAPLPLQPTWRRDDVSPCVSACTNWCLSPLPWLERRVHLAQHASEAPLLVGGLGDEAPNKNIRAHCPNTFHTKPRCGLVAPQAPARPLLSICIFPVYIRSHMCDEKPCGADLRLLALLHLLLQAQA